MTVVTMVSVVVVRRFYMSVTAQRVVVTVGVIWLWWLGWRYGE